ncbi:uncharacterized protein LOC127779404 isoform X2 [Oryza glaberrima]|uniref:uncharacterized protein LOC127779404 isoform X2 n=1 Tax=Oryza glaberrima TaxID=4538 RepID=UPI00224C33C6|nr:uncharacterized protein LOC127779404 isoform X2 [Oryza glaberrima]XP_052162126.1 uncharacterized protein LOC127779404 isoform X2 [Oryza glaberrima]
MNKVIHGDIRIPSYISNSFLHSAGWQADVFNWSKASITSLHEEDGIVMKMSRTKSLMAMSYFLNLSFLGVLGNGGGVPGQIRNFTSCGGGGGGGVLTGFLTGRSSDIAVFQFKKMMSTSTIPEKQGGVSVMSTSTVSEKQGGGCVELDSTKNKDREIEAIVSKIISREYRQRMDAMVLQDLYQKLGTTIGDSNVSHESLTAIVSSAIKKSSPSAEAEWDAVIGILVHHFRIRGQGGPSAPSTPAGKSDGGTSDDEESMSTKVDTMLTYLNLPDGPRKWLTARVKVLEKEGKAKGSSKMKIWKLMLRIFWWITLMLWFFNVVSDACTSVPKAYEFVCYFWSFVRDYFK